MKHLAGIVCLTVLCCAVPRASADVAEDLVLDFLRGKGIPLGLNSQAGEIVAIGHASCPADPSGDDFAALRDKYYKVASLHARSEILLSLAVASSATRNAGLHHDGISGERTAALACTAFSERILSGWWVLVSREHLDGNRLSVAVAVAWSPFSEHRFDDLKAGHLVPSLNWKDELLAYIKGQDLSSWADVRLFVDSAGFPHLMGVGVSDWNGHTLFRDAALRRADMFAQKNLLLALYGDAAVREAAGKWRRDVSPSSGKDAGQMSFYESLAEVSVTMSPPKGCRPIYVDEVTGHEGRKMIVSVFSFEPPVVEPGVQVMEKRTDAGVAGVPSSGILIWNPKTGKFEKQ